MYFTTAMPSSFPIPAVYLKTDVTTGQRGDRMEHQSRSWRLYRRPDD